VQDYFKVFCIQGERVGVKRKLGFSVAAENMEDGGERVGRGKNAYRRGGGCIKALG